MSLSPTPYRRRLASRGSADQLEQVVRKPGNNPKHEMKPDFFCSSNHDLISPEIFFPAAVEPLRRAALPVADGLIGRQGITSCPQFLSMMGPCPRVRLAW